MIRKRLKLLKKSILILHLSELAWMEQNEAGINARKLLSKFCDLLFWYCFFFLPQSLTVFLVWLYIIFGKIKE